MKEHLSSHALTSGFPRDVRKAASKLSGLTSSKSNHAPINEEDASSAPIRTAQEVTKILIG